MTVVRTGCRRRVHAATAQQHAHSTGLLLVSHTRKACRERGLLLRQRALDPEDQPLLLTSVDVMQVQLCAQIGETCLQVRRELLVLAQEVPVAVASHRQVGAQAFLLAVTHMQGARSRGTERAGRVSTAMRASRAVRGHGSTPPSTR